MSRSYLLVCLLGAAYPVAGLAASHCGESEKTYFSCKVRGSAKVVSLCGAPNLLSGSQEDLQNGWLQYRFGVLGKPELVYPAQKKGSVFAFLGSWSQHKQISPQDTWGFDETLSFRNGTAEYAITIARYEREVYGVGVTQGAKFVSFPCAGASAERHGTVGDENRLFSELVRVVPQKQ